MSTIFKYITNTDINKLKNTIDNIYQGNSVLNGRRDFLKELSNGLHLIQKGSSIKEGATGSTTLSDDEIEIEVGESGNTQKIVINIGGFSETQQSDIRARVVSFLTNKALYHDEKAKFETAYNTFTQMINNLKEGVKSCKTACVSSHSNGGDRAACIVGCSLKGPSISASATTEKEIKAYDSYVGNYIKNCNEYTNNSKKTACLGANITSTYDNSDVESKYNEINDINNKLIAYSEQIINDVNKLKEYNVDILQNKEEMIQTITDKTNEIENKSIQTKNVFSSKSKDLLNARIFDSMKKKQAYDLRNTIWLILAISLGLATLYRIKKM